MQLTALTTSYYVMQLWQHVDLSFNKSAFVNLITLNCVLLYGDPDQVYAKRN